MVRFQENEDEYVEMEVEDESEFPITNNGEANFGEENMVNSESSEEEGEISFNNNANRVEVGLTIGETSMANKQNNGYGNKRQQKEESETDKENRIIIKTVQKLQEMMAAGGYFNNPVRVDDKEQAKGRVPAHSSKNTRNTEGKNFQNQEKECASFHEADRSISESTIYQNAVQPAEGEKDLVNVINVCDDKIEVGQPCTKDRSNDLRVSTSSEEELINSSDENLKDTPLDDKIVSFLVNLRNNANTTELNVVGEPQPSTLRGVREENRGQQKKREEDLPHAQRILEQNVTKLIREVETSKARALDLQGKVTFDELDNTNKMNPGLMSKNTNGNFVMFAPNQFMRTVIMDEDYLIVAAHIDENIERRIRDGEFVNFSCLLPRDRVLKEQDNRIKLINQNGLLSCTPVSDSGNSSSINSFQRWEQAFQIFSNIYTKQFPQRSSELIQYNHVIHTASLSYSWSNVYGYDIDFRLHMARHPQRSWSVILQQAWNLWLKDRHDNNGRNGGNNFGLQSSYRRKDICFHFKAGKCTYGLRCKFDHRCGICGKFGHGAFNCRRAFDKDNNSCNDRYDRYNRNHDRRGDKRRDSKFDKGGAGVGAVKA